VTIPLVAPLYDDSDVEAVLACVRELHFSSGPVARQFEEAMAAFLGIRGCVATTSGTAALHLALVALGVGPGDEVVIPSYTCVAVLHAVHLVGATPVIVDSRQLPERMDFNIDPEAVEGAIGPGTAGVIAPHTFGVTADIEALRSFGKPVIEDAAMATGAHHAGTPADTMGDLATFSFQENKMISSGEGGMVACAGGDLLRRVRERNTYLERQLAVRTTPAGDVLGSYELETNFRLADTSSALGLSQLRRLGSFIERRRAIADAYNEGFKDLDIITPRSIPPGAVFYRYVVDISPTGQDVARVILQMAERGIEVGRGVYPALHHYVGQSTARVPRAEACTRGNLSLPVHPALTERDVAEIIDAFTDLLRG
jgi:perosamine synthetase